MIDFDVGLRNLDLVMGCERRVVFDFVNLIQGEARLNQALIKDKRNEYLFVLPASQTRDKDALTQEGVGKVLDELAEQFDVHPKRISAWKKEFLAGAENAFGNSKEVLRLKDSEQEKEELFKEIGKLKVENDWLKKKLL